MGSTGSRVRALLTAATSTAVLAACGVPGPVEDSAESATDAQADVLGVRITNSERVASYGNMTTDNLIQAVLDQERVELMVAETVEPRTDDSIYEWTRLVVRLHGRADRLFGTQEEVVACWEYLYEGRFQRGNERHVECPNTEPLAVEPIVPPRMPQDSHARLDAVLTDLSPAEARDVAAARARLEAEFTDLGRAVLQVVVVNSTVGVTITDGDSCAMARRLPDGTVEVWKAQSADAITDTAWCPAEPAAHGNYKTAPH